MSLFARLPRHVSRLSRGLSGFPGTPTGSRLIKADGQPRVALVSGGASGIGRASALRMASEGAIVVVADLPMQEAAAHQVIGELNAENQNGKHQFITLDVTVEDQWAAAIKTVEKEYGHLDVLVNNAGVYFNEGMLTEEPLKTFQKVQDVNVNGVFLGTKHAIPLMARAKSEYASIINMCSVAGLMANGGPIAGYFTSKGAVRLFTKAAAMQCATMKYPIRVNSVHPGVIITPLWDRGFVPGEGTDPSRAMIKPFGGESLAQLEVAVQSMTPLGRNGRAEDIAELVTFLASNESSFCTGAEFVSDGGLTAQ